MKLFLILTFLLGATFANAQQFLQSTPAAEQWVNKAFHKLSRKQKIAQLMVLRLSERSNNQTVFLEDQVTQALRRYDIGSVCLFQGRASKQAEVLNRLQARAKTPLMVCVDGETGVGMRFADVVPFPDQLTIGAVSDPGLAYKVGKAIGEQCKRIAIQVDYAPVVDINNNPDNPVINYRSLGEDKYKVALLGSQIMKGIQDQGVMACAKHFPGHGDVAVDSHLDLPVINKSMQALDTLELYPFRQLIKEGVGSVMIAHLYIPAIDTIKNQATSLSRRNVTGLLKETLGFKGLTFTDALEMKGVTKFYPQGQAAVQSLIAGNDMLCLPGDVKGSIKKARKAIRHHQLTWKEVDEKVHKVLLAKYNLGLNTLSPIDSNALARDLNKDVAPLKKEVYENAITLLRNTNKTVLPLAKEKKVAFVGIGLAGPNHFARLIQSNWQTDCYYFPYSSDSSQINSLVSKLSTYEAVVVGIHQFRKFPANNFGLSKAAVTLARQIEQNEKSVSFVFGNPYTIKNFAAAPNLVACYEDDSLMHDVAFQLLKGTIIAKGTLPVTVDPAFHWGFGLISRSDDASANPISAGLDITKLDRIDSIANNAIAKKAFPGCVVLVARNGKIGFLKAYGHMDYDHNQPVTTQTVYDLASVTKTSATTMAVMKLYEEGRLDLDKQLGDYLPWTRGSDKAGLTLRNIMLHQAGLVSFIPFYRETIDTRTGKPKPGYYQSFADQTYSIPVADKMFLRRDFSDTLTKRILQSKLGPANQYVYSDNDFILMGKVVEQITALPLDQYVARTFYRPLGMKSTTFNPLRVMPQSDIAPTENEKIFRLQQIRGYVHDPGAALFGGVAGHAGLFSNAEDLFKIYQLLLNGGTYNGVRYLKKSTIDYFTAYQSTISRRGLGFDKPEKDNATSPEPYPTKSASPATFGHTGFTGISVWADPKENLLYIFLSNRVCPDGENTLISKLGVRAAIFENIYQSIIR